MGQRLSECVVVAPGVLIEWPSAQQILLGPGASGDPFSPLRPVFFNREVVVAHTMKADQKTTAELEPVGIVISRGRHEEKPSVFSAYVWGSAPEAGPNDGKTVAA